MSFASLLSSPWSRVPLLAFAVVATVATSQPPTDPPPGITPGVPGAAPAAERITLGSGESRDFTLRFDSTGGAVISSRLAAFDNSGSISIRVDHEDSRPGCSTSEVFRSANGAWLSGALADGNPVLRSSCLDTSPSGTVKVKITNVDQTSTRFTWSPVGEPLGGDRDAQGRAQTVTLERVR